MKKTIKELVKGDVILNPKNEQVIFLWSVGRQNYIEVYYAGGGSFKVPAMESMVG